MNNEEIKKECEMLYAQIAQANERLKELREICPHEETFVGNYVHQRPSIMETKICSCCYTPIPDNNITNVYSSFNNKINIKPGPYSSVFTIKKDITKNERGNFKFVKSFF